MCVITVPNPPIGIIAFPRTQDVVHFHQTLKTACDKHDPTFYCRYKDWCDRYFVITHRNERRGVGGIFFDDHAEHGQKASFEFVQTCAHAIGEAFLPIVERNMDQPYTELDRDWQLIRRGRYVEFNLVYDRGTKFGLATPEARIESILMSLPLLAVCRCRFRGGVSVDMFVCRNGCTLTSPMTITGRRVC